jgi:uncharacterized protein
MYSEKELTYIKEFIQERPECVVYLGVDSQRLKKKKVKFATVICVHYIDENGVGKGAKVFADVSYEKIEDTNLSRPFQRMMREVTMVTEVYNALEDILLEREFEIHLDISENPEAGSNVAHGAAKGYIMGLVGIEPIMKPHAFAASVAADKYSKN